LASSVPPLTTYIQSNPDYPFWLFALAKASIPLGGLKMKNCGYRQTRSESTAVRPFNSFELIPLIWRKLNIEIRGSRGEEMHRHFQRINEATPNSFFQIIHSGKVRSSKPFALMLLHWRWTRTLRRKSFGRPCSLERDSRMIRIYYFYSFTIFVPFPDQISSFPS